MNNLFDVNPYQNKWKSNFYEYSNEPCNKERLSKAAKNGVDIWFNEITKINNLPYALKRRKKLKMKDIFMLENFPMPKANRSLSMHFFYCRKN